MSGRLRLQYSQFLELEMFSRFGGVSVAHVKGEILRGERIRALLTQPRFAILRLVDQVALLAALEAGALDALEPAAITSLREELPDRLDRFASAAVAECWHLARQAFTDASRASLTAATKALIDEPGQRGSMWGR
ncbi:MAG: hypothetical protein U1E25_15765 [Methylocystis sp.]